MLTRVRLLSLTVVMMVILSSCTMVQARSFARAAATDSPAQASTTAPSVTAAKAKTAAAKKTAAAAKKTNQVQFARRAALLKRRQIMEQTRIDRVRAAKARADRRAKAKKQAEINAVLRFLTAKAEEEARAADPYGYKRVEQYVSDAGLKRLRDCESTDRYWVTNPSGKYRGAYQFDFPTWNGVAERWFPHLVGVDPIDAPPEAQDAMTRALWSERGRFPWPECGLRV